MRRRTSPRVVWLPSPDDVAISTGSVYNTFFLDLAGALSIGAELHDDIPLVTDNPRPLRAIDTSLADVESTGYRLRRIVGKIWCAVDQVVQDDAGTVMCTAGIMVRRVDAGGAPVANSDPGNFNNMCDPWVWRRSWLLANAASTNTEDTFLITMPTANTQLGSVADGPHVDQKTARLVGPEERLFLTCGATLMNGQNEGTMRVRWATDLRVLGSMRTSSGNRRNASR